MRKVSIIVLHGVVHAVDQGKDAHQQVQPLPYQNIKSMLSKTYLGYNCCDKCIEYLLSCADIMRLVRSSRVPFITAE